MSYSQPFMLLMIPFLISMNWLIGGNLISRLNPLTLSSARVAVGALILIAFSSIRKRHLGWTRQEKLRWWSNQALLSMTGRAAYYYLSIRALALISPFEVVVISTLLPVFVLLTERLAGVRFKNFKVVLFGTLSCVLACMSLLSANPEQARFSLGFGHLLMAGAMLLYAIHLSIYRRLIRDPNPADPLLAQFAIAALILIPLDLSGYSQFLTLAWNEWLQFFVYSVICNLIPFVLVHHCIQRSGPFAIGAASVLSPLFAFAMRGIYTGRPVSGSFMIQSLLACGFVLLTLRADRVPNPITTGEKLI